MRIIAGTKRGMKLLPPKGGTTRPIIDRVKESIFNVLYKYDLIKGRTVADLFCGTGSFGLEALSRGAKRVCFVESNTQVIEILKKNIQKARFESQAEVIRTNVFTAGAPLQNPADKYSLIFVDPPFAATADTGKDSPLGRLLCSLGDRLAEDGIVVVRTEKNNRLQDKYGPLHIVDARQWSSMLVTFLRMEK